MPLPRETLEGFRNQVQHVEEMARCAFFACQSQEVGPLVRDSVGTVIDSVVAELADLRDEMDKRIKANPEERILNLRNTEAVCRDVPSDKT